LYDKFKASFLVFLVFEKLKYSNKIFTSCFFNNCIYNQLIFIKKEHNGINLLDTDGETANKFTLNVLKKLFTILTREILTKM
jgi:3-isopropylmalate dehydratase small subunit